jgi:hypothetical protein
MVTQSIGGTRSARAAERRRRALLAVGSVLTLAAVVHHVDHVVRGKLVAAEQLPAAWGHSGWPFQGSVTPFTASLAIYLLLVPGVVMNATGRLAARWWAVTSVLLLLVVGAVHFLPVPGAESPGVIWDTYAFTVGPLPGALALLDLAGVVVLLVVQLELALRASRVAAYR